MSDYDDPYGPMPMDDGPKSKPANKRQGPPSGYVEVKDRIMQFYAAYPTGAVVTEKVEWQAAGSIDELARVIVKAAAYRTPDDPHPGRGSSSMVLPGKTPYTNGSELENTETSAWGRAIAAVGIAVHAGIATASEIRSKGGEGTEQPSVSGAERLRQAAAAAAGDADVTGDADVAPEANGATESAAPPETGTEAPPEPERPTEAKEEAPEAVEVERDADGRVTKTTKRKAKGPVPDPEAQAAPTNGEAEGINYDDFIKTIREHYVPNGQVQQVARELVERGALRQVASVRELSDQERLMLLYAAIATNESAEEQASV